MSSTIRQWRYDEAADKLVEVPHVSPGKLKNYVKCPLCCQKFLNTIAGKEELKLHKVHRRCRERQLENDTMKKTALHLNETNAIKTQSNTSAVASQTTKTQPVPPPPPVSQKNSENPVEYVFPPELGPLGCWTRKCDRCGVKVNLGKSLNGGHFEGHRDSKGCQKVRKAMLAKGKYPEDEKDPKPRGIMKFFRRSSSQATLVEGEPSSSQVSQKFEVASELEPMSKPTPMSEPSSSRSTPAVKNNSKNALKAAKQELTPADADLTTLARDIRRALAEVPAKKTVKKRKNGDDDGNAKKRRSDVAATAL